MVGEKEIQGSKPVSPPTQLSQESINAVPLGSPLQSIGELDSVVKD